jgi:putative SOS response-associated peptidase YedK
MCGRYGIQSTEREIQSRFDLAQVAAQLPISFNVTPGMTMPVVVRESPNRLEMMRWGLIPSWAKDAKARYRTISARAETVATKPTYRKAFRSQRCLVPASGFYEWQKLPRSKQPYWISLKDEPLFALAGLWDAWEDPASGPCRELSQSRPDDGANWRAQPTLARRPLGSPGHPPKIKRV